MIIWNIKEILMKKIIIMKIIMKYNEENEK